MHNPRQRQSLLLSHLRHHQHNSPPRLTLRRRRLRMLNRHSSSLELSPVLKLNKIRSMRSRFKAAT
jgi:hypothetical protein